MLSRIVSDERGSYGSIELLILLGMGAVIAAVTVMRLTPALRSLHKQVVNSIIQREGTGF